MAQSHVWNTHLSQNLDTKDDDLILVRCSKCGELPVQDDLIPIQPNADLAAHDTAVADFEGNTLLKVSAHFPDLNATKEWDVQVDDYFYSEVDWVEVDDNLYMYFQRFEIRDMQ